MKAMLAPPKTLAQLQADVSDALRAYCDASARRSIPRYLHDNNIDRVDARIGHLWAQYRNAAKIRDAFFDQLMKA